MLTKIWGLKRTGTNLARYLIQRDCPGVTVWNNYGGWKHGPITLDPDWDCPRNWGKKPNAWRCVELSRDQAKACSLLSSTMEIRHVVMVKRPAAWLASIRRFEPRVRPANHARQWNIAYRQYAHCADTEPTVTMVRYEDLLGDSRALIQHIDKSVERSDLPEQATRKGTDADHGEDILSQFVFDPSRYTEGKYLDDLTESQLAEFSDALDDDLAERLGY